MIGRKKEYQQLEKLYDSRGFEFLVMYGRRRIGKTYLLADFLTTHKGVYFMAKEKDEAGNVQGLWRALSRHFTNLPSFAAPSDLDSILSFLDNAEATPSLFLVIDEYQWFSNDIVRLNAIFQEHIDRWAREKRPIHLVLCGSVISMMRSITDDKESPLYGRQTAKLELLPFTYKDISDFFPNMDSKGKLEAYMLTGGVGYYLSLYRPDDTPASFIKRNLISTMGPLRGEVATLIREEVRKGGPYLRLLSLIAEGKTTFAELLPEFENKSALLSSYLDALSNKLCLIEKAEPALGGKNKPHYRIIDLFCRMYFQLIYPNIDDPAYHIDEDVFASRYITKERINTFFGSAFEDVCRNFMDLCSVYGRLPDIFPSFHGHWENDKETSHEFDLASISKKGCLILGECKWTEREASAGKYFEMAEYANKHYPSHRFEAYFFSRSGFSTRLVSLAKENERIHLLDIDSLFENFD